MSDQNNKGTMPIWLVAGIIMALVAAVVGVASKNAKGNKRYEQLVGAIEELINEGRAKAEGAADALADTGESLAKDLKRGLNKSKRRAG